MRRPDFLKMTGETQKRYPSLSLKGQWYVMNLSQSLQVPQTISQTQPLQVPVCYHAYFGCIEHRPDATQTFSQCPCAVNFMLTIFMFVGPSIVKP